MSERPTPFEALTGQEFIYSTSELRELSYLSRGNQGTVFTGTFETEAGKKETVVLKKFYKPKSRTDSNSEIENCRFLSQTAAEFREAGLPVLPLVKSVVTFKDVSKVAHARYDRNLASVKPPYVLMSFLQKSDRVASVLDFGTQDEDVHEKIFNLLDENPQMLDLMVEDMARIHALGYTRSITPLVDAQGMPNGDGPHPVPYSWMFTENTDGTFERWLVDLNNFIRIQQQTPKDQLLSDPNQDMEDLLDFFMEYLPDIAKSEAEYYAIYKTAFDKAIADKK